MSYANLRKTSTIQELINSGKFEQFTADKLHFKQVIDTGDDKIIINLYSVLDRYIEQLKQILVEVELTDYEYEIYKYNPKRLCVDIYDNIDLAFLILRMNNMTSVTEFKSKKLLLFKKNILISYLNEILMLEKERITLNSAEVSKLIEG